MADRPALLDDVLVDLTYLHDDVIVTFRTGSPTNAKLLWKWMQTHAAEGELQLNLRFSSFAIVA